MRHIRIAFDGKRAAQNRTGLGNYSRFVLNALASRSDVEQLDLYVPHPSRTDLLGALASSAKVSLCGPTSFGWQRFSSLWRVFALSSQLESDGVSLFHGLSNELPLGIEKTSVRSVVTIHDLIFRRYPEYYGFVDRQIYDYKFRRACQSADRIIAVSECTKRDIVSFYGTDPNKIDVVYQGCDPLFASEVSDSTMQEVRSKYDLPDNYILFVGSIERRKNLMLAAKALRSLPSDVHLVAVGRRTSYTAEVEAFAQSNGLSCRLHVLTGVPLQDLPSLYHMARVFVYPSRFEGFGIPILEALTSGTPVVACTGSCLEEAGGPSSLYVSPDDHESLARCISDILGSDSLRQKMIADGRAYAANFSPEKLTDDLLSVYDRVVAL